MDAEIRFFMTPEDEATFINFAQKHIDEVVMTDSPKQRFIVGDCELLFTPTQSEGNTLYSGVLEIRIDATDENSCKNQMRANMSYKKLRNWIKKNYWSRLAFLNKRDQLAPSRIHWLAPEAKIWKESDPENHLLKLSKTSWMVFDIGY